MVVVMAVNIKRLSLNYFGSLFHSPTPFWMGVNNSKTHMQSPTSRPTTAWSVQILIKARGDISDKFIKYIQLLFLYIFIILL